MAENPKPQVLSRTAIYENLWVNLYVDKVLFPDGRLIERHHVLDFERAAVLVVVENEVGEILLVQTYRYIVDALDWELPGGVIEKGEEILDAARREVREESGFETTDHELIYSYYTIIGIGNHTEHIVTCKAVTGNGSFDKNEVKAFRWFTKAEILQLIQQKTFKDVATIAGLLLYFSKTQ